MPANTTFGSHLADRITEMTVDEYETIRLIDLEGLTQEECSLRMEVSRTTAQAIYSSARKKLADCLINNNLLKIQGGDYRICEKSGKCNKKCPDKINRLKNCDKEKKNGSGL
jgi:predicted DNA-binding protein (UPF0251 family)